MVFIILPAIVLLDQLTKFVITHKIALNQSVPVLKGIFYFTLVHNRGAAFGIFNNQVPFFILTSICAIILIILNFKKDKRALYNISLSLILAGAAGNLIDRVFLGYVVDFLDFRIWPVFNVADSSITIGAILLAWNILFPEKEGLQSHKSQVTSHK